MGGPNNPPNLSEKCAIYSTTGTVSILLECLTSPPPSFFARPRAKRARPLGEASLGDLPPLPSLQGRGSEARQRRRERAPSARQHRGCGGARASGGAPEHLEEGCTQWGPTPGLTVGWLCSDINKGKPPPSSGLGEAT